MPELNAQVMVFHGGNQIGGDDEIGRQLTTEQLDDISNLVDYTIGSLQKQLSSKPKPAAGQLAISEINVSFGIELEAKGKTSILLRPIGSFEGRAGATFEVSIKLSRVKDGES